MTKREVEQGLVRDALAVAEEIAAHASLVLLQGFRSDPDVELKGAIDLVTAFDRESERVVVDRLRAAFPDHTIVAEETGLHAGEGAAPSPDLTWYVDPLDGTTNFAHGLPSFSVSIALCCDGRPIVGVVEAPALGLRWSGARGLGVTRRARGFVAAEQSAPAAERRQRCRVSSSKTLETALGATGFPYDRHETRDDNLRELGFFVKRTRGIRRCGSAAMDLAFVADGAFDFYWEQRLQPWDIAAGALLVEEAGGRLTDYDGSAADVRRGRLVASNGRLHDAVIRGLAQARRDIG